MTNESVSILSAESIMFGRGELIVLKFQNVQNEKYSDCLWLEILTENNRCRISVLIDWWQGRVRIDMVRNLDEVMKERMKI